RVERGGKLAVPLFELQSFGDDLPGDHRAKISATLVGDGAHEQIERLGPQLNRGPMREVRRVGKQLPLMGRVRMKQIDARAQQAVDRHGEKLLQLAKLLAR